MSDLGNKEIFAKNLNYYMNINNKDRNDVARDLDLPYTTITGWCKAEFYPRIDKIQLLANYFGIQKSDLVEQKSLNSTSLSNEEYFIETKIRYGKSAIEHLENYYKLNELGKQTADIYVEGLTEVPKFTEKKQDNTANG